MNFYTLDVFTNTTKDKKKTFYNVVLGLENGTTLDFLTDYNEQEIKNVLSAFKAQKGDDIVIKIPHIEKNYLEKNVKYDKYQLTKEGKKYFTGLGLIKPRVLTKINF